MTTPRRERHQNPATAPTAGAKIPAEMSEPYDPPDPEDQWPTGRPAYLIVVGNRGMGALAGHLLGSVPGDIAHRAPCDVLIVQTEQVARDDQLSA